MKLAKRFAQIGCSQATFAELVSRRSGLSLYQPRVSAWLQGELGDTNTARECEATLKELEDLLEFYAPLEIDLSDPKKVSETLKRHAEIQQKLASATVPSVLGHAVYRPPQAAKGFADVSPDALTQILETK